jgi:hypothetical protein
VDIASFIRKKGAGAEQQKVPQSSTEKLHLQVKCNHHCLMPPPTPAHRLELPRPRDLKEMSRKDRKKENKILLN